MVKNVAREVERPLFKIIVCVRVDQRLMEYTITADDIATNQVLLTIYVKGVIKAEFRDWVCWYLDEAKTPE